MKKRVFVTGGSRGIGKEIVKRFQIAGCEVVAPTRKELDLASTGSVKDYFSRYGQLEVDVLINNAGENKVMTIKELSVENCLRMLTVNLAAPFLLIKLIAPYMVEKRWGRIVNISSIYSLVSRNGRAGYGASKSGLNSLTRTAALEYAEYGVLVNAVCPGFVDTELTRRNNSPAQIEELRNQVPLKRLALPQEIAEFVYFLGSEQNMYITGQVMTIDGGFTAE